MVANQEWTDGVLLRTWHPDVADKLFPDICESTLYEFVSQVPPRTAAEFIQQCDRRARIAEVFTVHLCDADETSIGLIEIYQAEPAKFSIGLQIGSRFWRKGLGRKTVLAALSLLESEHGDVLVEAVVDDRNVASARLFETCGFTEVGRRDAILRFLPTTEVLFHRSLKPST